MVRVGYEVSLFFFSLTKSCCIIASSSVLRPSKFHKKSNTQGPAFSHTQLSRYFYCRYLNSFSKTWKTDTFENVYCNIRNVKSNYLKCIASQCLSCTLCYFCFKVPVVSGFSLLSSRTDKLLMKGVIGNKDVVGCHDRKGSTRLTRPRMTWRVSIRRVGKIKKRRKS